MAHPLMPKAVAVWLIDNTTLTFDQIGDFCGLHPIEVQAIADGDVNMRLSAIDPLMTGELSQEEIDKAQEKPAYRMAMTKNSLPKPRGRTKGPRYTPISKRGDKPDGISYLLKMFPDLTDSQIIRLIGTTKNTINNIRERTHINISNIKPRNPVELGLCKQDEIEKAVERSQKKNAKKEAADAKKAEKAAGKVEAETTHDVVVETPETVKEAVAVKTA